MNLSVIIPFRDKPELLNDCLKTMYEFRAFEGVSEFEIILVDNGSSKDSILKLNIPEKLNTKMIEANVPFNFQFLVNLGAKNASGKFLLFLNNDILFKETSKGCFQKLMSIAARKTTGAVGPLLMYADDTIQHAGVVIGMGGYADHLYRTWSRSQAASFNFTPYNQNRPVSAVTGACLLVESQKFWQVGGFNEDFIVCGGDVDVCLRLALAGFQNFYCGEVELVHLESKSRDPSKIPEIDFLESEKSYKTYLQANGGRDPFYPIPLPLNFEPPNQMPVKSSKNPAAQVRNLAGISGNQMKQTIKRVKTIIKKMAVRLRSEPPEKVFADAIFKLRKKIFRRKALALLQSQKTFKSFIIPHMAPVSFHSEFYEHPNPRINILIPHLDPRGIYGGIATAALLGLKFKAKYPDIGLRFLLTDGDGEVGGLNQIMKPFFENGYDDIEYEIVPLFDRNLQSVGVHHKDTFIATAWWTCYAAKELSGAKPFVYLIQDYEPCFYPWGEEFAAASATYSMNFIPVFNSSILRDFFDKQKIISNQTISNGSFFNPAIDEGLFKPIERFTVKNSNKKKLFFYGRPSVARNLFATGVLGIARAVDDGLFQPDDWEFISAGEHHDPIDLGKGACLVSMGKISYSEYASLLRDVDLGVSLMLSPHPSYPPLEIASVGALCVTNRYENKDLSVWHPNIISCAPSAEGVRDGIAEALRRISDRGCSDSRDARNRSQICYSWDTAFENCLNVLNSIVLN